MNKEFGEGATRKLLNETTAEEVMSKPVKTLHVDEPFSEVENIFVNHHYRHLPIVNDKRELVGIITQKDLYKLVSPRRAVAKTIEYDGDKILDGNSYYSKEILDSYILRHVMTKNVHTLGLKNTIGEVIHSIVSNDISSVVIVDDKRKVLGLVTTFDIMKLADKIFMGNQKNG